MFALLLAVVPPGQAQPTPVDPGQRGSTPARTTLFVGNSQTATHDVPDLVDQLHRAAGIGFSWEAITRGGETLQRHAERTDARSPLRTLAVGRWSTVVLQEHGRLAAAQRPRGLEPFSLAPARLFARAARGRGTGIVLFMTWPPRDHPDWLRGIETTYTRLANDLEARIAPAGIAFQAAGRALPEIALYTDDVHASEAGAYLAACVLFSTLTQRSPVGLTVPSAIDAGAGARLQEIAWETVSSYRQATP